MENNESPKDFFEVKTNNETIKFSQVDDIDNLPYWLQQIIRSDKYRYVTGYIYEG